MRLRSTVCTTEVLVTRGAGDLDLRCGGAAMAAAEAGAAPEGSPDPSYALGTQVGKRYVAEGHDLEVLCTTAGEGTLSVGEDPLALKGHKPPVIFRG